MNIPEKCKDCSFLNTYNKEPKCMLGHPFGLAAGCPNKEPQKYKVNE